MKPMAIFIMGSGVTDMNPSAGCYNLGLLRPPHRFWRSR
jgi:hypothetical protein